MDPAPSGFEAKHLAKVTMGNLETELDPMSSIPLESISPFSHRTAFMPGAQL